MRSEVLTADDLAQANDALCALEEARIELDDLRERCLRKGDEARAGRARVAMSQLAIVRETLEASWR